MTLRKKLWITIACLSVILCTLVTGSIAWLTDKTPEVKNTFTPSNITVQISETNFALGSDGNYSKEFKMIPGKTYAKDPKVTVSTDIPCYVFVKVEENLGAWAGEGNFSDFFTYSVRTGDNEWTAVPNTTGVYYIETSANTVKYILADGTGDYVNGQITVSGAVTKEMMEKLYVTGAAMPTLTFTAYACQKEGFANAATAWAEVNK